MRERPAPSALDAVNGSRPVTCTPATGYTFPLTTDSDCRNRLLHSRPIEGSEFMSRLWGAGIRGYRAVFNVPGDPVRDLVAAYRRTLESLAAGGKPSSAAAREIVGQAFTRGHFARAV